LCLGLASAPCRDRTGAPIVERHHFVPGQGETSKTLQVAGPDELKQGLAIRAQRRILLSHESSKNSSVSDGAARSRNAPRCTRGRHQRRLRHIRVPARQRQRLCLFKTHERALVGQKWLGMSPRITTAVNPPKPSSNVATSAQRSQRHHRGIGTGPRMSRMSSVADAGAGASPMPVGQLLLRRQSGWPTKDRRGPRQNVNALLVSSPPPSPRPGKALSTREE